MVHMQRSFEGWESLKPIGEGGQSKVFLVRNPGRVKERHDAIMEAKGCNPWQPYLTENERPERIETLARSVWTYVRPDKDSELGALKIFKIPENPPEKDEALGRFQNEVSVLRELRPGLIKLLAVDEKDRWVITEYMRSGTVEDNIGRYKGSASRALRAFRSVVETVAELHGENVVHRDIKPANVFLGEEDRLVLGDLGIVYLPDQAERLTTTNERVGPRDYMPPWADRGQRVPNVQTNFDVYMLGKLLWCMVSGRLKLHREDYLDPDFDVAAFFPNDLGMLAVNEILGKCVVTKQEQCLKSAHELLVVVDESLATLERGTPISDAKGKLTLPCRICGRGYYQEHYPEGQFRLPGYDQLSRPTNPVHLRLFVCNVCTHYEFFAPGGPDEAARRGWTPWRPKS
jgi:serine/threonine protein kinase